MRNLKTRSLIAFLCVTMCWAAEAFAQIKPSALFSDHLVLQSGMPVPIWGTADPAEKIAVKFYGQTRSATADAAGKWMVRLTKLKPGGPFEMTIAGNKPGEAQIVVKDILWARCGSDPGNPIWTSLSPLPRDTTSRE
jgi:sialate O-acetylesterase